LKVVVTGGAGFIGSHLVKGLLDEGREVIVVDDLSSGNMPNLYDLGVEVECRRADLRNYDQTVKALDGVDVVFHLAACVGGMEYLHGDGSAELRALQSNLAIDTNVFRVCMERKVKKIVYASSVAVYPIDLQQRPGAVLCEKDLRYYDPDGGYGWAKLIAERQLDWMKNISVGIARIFNVYGPCEQLGEMAHVIPTLVRKAIVSPEDFVVLGDGAQSRCFTYVSDCVDALMRLEQKTSNEPVIVNVGSDKTVPIRVIAEKIVRISHKAIRIRYDPSGSFGPVSRTANISKASALLGWQPRISLDKGLKRTYAWAEKRLARVSSTGLYGNADKLLQAKTEADLQLKQ
jgi:nucleoside-diphosphate-sugar epimerase